MNNKKLKIQIWIRFVIQLVFFILAPSVYHTAFSGVKYIFTQIGAGKTVEMTAFVTHLIVLCAYTIIFGRFFCGFACAFGSLGDWIRGVYVWICKKLKRKPMNLPGKIRSALCYLKYLVLVGIIVLCHLGIFGKLSGGSPWEVFSLLIHGNFRVVEYTTGCTIFLFILIGMLMEERFFCRNLCPMGAIFTLLPVIPYFTLFRDKDHCITGCKRCKNLCPSDLELPYHGHFEVQGDCFQCQKCANGCPKENVSYGIKGLKGNSVVMTLVKTVILAVTVLALGGVS